MRLIALLLALVSMQAQATLINFDINMNVNAGASSWLLGGPTPSTVNGSFVLDTSSFDAQLRFGPIPSSPQIFLQEISVSNVPVSNIRFSAGGTNLWTSDSGSSNFFAQWVEFRNFEGAFGMSDQGRSFIDADARFFGLAPYSLANFLVSPDPLFDVLVNWNPIVPALRGEWGSLVGGTTTVVRKVPEPGALSLLCSGLIGLALLIRHRRNAYPA
jgi:hypothetical protein